MTSRLNLLTRLRCESNWSHSMVSPGASVMVFDKRPRATPSVRQTTQTQTRPRMPRRNARVLGLQTAI
eukprot:11191402-Lingulodinium_polyedra.AAC.1